MKALFRHKIQGPNLAPNLVKLGGAQNRSRSPEFARNQPNKSPNLPNTFVEISSDFVWPSHILTRKLIFSPSRRKTFPREILHPPWPRRSARSHPPPWGNLLGEHNFWASVRPSAPARTGSRAHAVWRDNAVFWSPTRANGSRSLPIWGEHRPMVRLNPETKVGRHRGNSAPTD